jgi:ABC-2 type transport system ATP-binding protein
VQAVGDDAAMPRRAPSRPGHDVVRSLRSAGAFRQPREIPVTPEPAAQVAGGAEQVTDTPALDGPEGKSALVVEHLTKRFGDRVAFDDVSFEVGYGEVFGFLGPNGAGKTTTVRTLGTLIAPSSGSAIVAGIPVTAKNGPAIRARISLMPESPGLYLRLTVAENLKCFAGLYQLADARYRIDRALQAVNLTDRANDLCGSLSKGLRQRVALARALLNDPAVLFLDEPTSGLDPVATREVHDLIASLRERGVTIFLTTHRLEEAERLCHRVAILNTTLRLVAGPPSSANSCSPATWRCASGRRSVTPAGCSTGCLMSIAGRKNRPDRIGWPSQTPMPLPLPLPVHW